MGRHAYMIVAHQQWKLLSILLHLLDDERNDIYVHVDKRVKEVPFKQLGNTVKKSKLVFVDRIPVYRGSFSLFEAELILLRSALSNGKYSYFHLLSGQDLPIKNQDFIHGFFENNKGSNFIDVITPDRMKRDWYERISLYQPFSRYTLSKPIVAIPARCIRKVSLVIQKTLNVNRVKKYEEQGHVFCYGSNWFSITEAFAEYMVEKEGLIRQIFQKHTFAPEELIPQSLLWSSEYKNTVYDSVELDGKLQRANLRAVFWTGKASPETITMKHLEEVWNTTNLFARKFDLEKYPETIDAIIERIANRSS